MSITEPTLADKMRATKDPKLIELADTLDANTKGFYAEPQTVSVKQFMGSWARARRAWCDYSGEPLI